MTYTGASYLSRRDFLAASAATISASVLPSEALAQSARFRRWEITDPAMPPRVLTSYKAGIRKMLGLAPTDPRNWYRNALVHLFDCPHGNWWFLVWHRAYLGWLEVTLRDLSGDPEFALPYWDWTKTPRVPTAMFDGVLDPNDGAFIATFDQFKSPFEPAITALYASFSQAQKAQLALRPFPFTTPTEFWQILPQVFFDQPSARGLTATNPDLDANTKVTVATDMIRSALRTPTFAGERKSERRGRIPERKGGEPQQGEYKGYSRKPASQQCAWRNGRRGRSLYGLILLIRGSRISTCIMAISIGYGMSGRAGKPRLDGPRCRKAPISLHGRTSHSCSSVTKRSQPVSKTKAGDYTTMGVFDYDYSPGAGEDQVPAPTPAVAARPDPGICWPGHARGGCGKGLRQAPSCRCPPRRCSSLTSPEAAPRVAEITLDLTHSDQGRRFRVLVSPGDGAAPIAAGAITVFGHPHTGPATFTVPLPENLGVTAAAGGNVPLNIQVVPIGPAVGSMTAAAVAAPPQISAIQVRTN